MTPQLDIPQRRTRVDSQAVTTRHTAATMPVRQSQMHDDEDRIGKLLDGMTMLLDRMAMLMDVQMATIDRRLHAIDERIEQIDARVSTCRGKRERA